MNERERTNGGNTILLAIIGIATLLIAVVGATFAYFSATVTGTDTATTIRVYSGTLGITFADTGDGNIEIPDASVENGTALYPREEAWATKTFSVTGVSSATAQLKYELYLAVTHNSFTDTALTYDFKTTTTTDGGDTIKLYQDNIDDTAKEDATGTEVTNQVIKQYLTPTTTNDIHLASSYFQGPTGSRAGTDPSTENFANRVHNYTLKIYFKPSANPQNDDQDKKFAAYIKTTAKNTNEA